MLFGLVPGEVGWGYIGLSSDGRGTRVVQIISGHRGWGRGSVMMLVSGPTDTLGSRMRGCNDKEPAGLHLRLGAHCEHPPGLPAPEQVLQPRHPAKGRWAGGRGQLTIQGVLRGRVHEGQSVEVKVQQAVERQEFSWWQQSREAAGPDTVSLALLAGPAPNQLGPRGSMPRRRGATGQVQPEVTVTFPGHLEPPGELCPLLSMAGPAAIKAHTKGGKATQVRVSQR